MNTQYEAGNISSSTWTFPDLIGYLVGKPMPYENEGMV